MNTAPGFWQLARRPKWIAALLLVLVVAAVFAALGRWQLERSVAASVVNEVDTETVVDLTELTAPTSPVTGDQLGRLVRLEGEVEPGSSLVLRDRVHERVTGYWAIARLLVETGEAGERASLVVALGWAATEQQAREALPTEAVALEVQGRYLPAEPPREADLDHPLRSAVSIADFVNLWPAVDEPVFAGYVIADEAPAGLTVIDAPPPIPEATVNWLNVFYALEWVIFAGFAIYLWYRLVKDEVEKRAEEATVD